MTDRYVSPDDFVTVTREGTRYVVDTKPIKAVKTESA